MDRHILKLVKDTPNDQDLGAKIRAYVFNSKRCCSKKKNKSVYIDGIGNKWPQCKECGRLLI